MVLRESTDTFTAVVVPGAAKIAQEFYQSVIYPLDHAQSVLGSLDHRLLGSAPVRTQFDTRPVGVLDFLEADVRTFDPADVRRLLRNVRAQSRNELRAIKSEIGIPILHLAQTGDNRRIRRPRVVSRQDHWIAGPL